MHTIFPPSTSRSRRPRLHHRSTGVIAAAVVLWSLNVTRTNHSGDDANSTRPFLDLQAIAAQAALIGDSST